jgi:hypothetical protein
MAASLLGLGLLLGGTSATAQDLSGLPPIPDPPAVKMPAGPAPLPLGPAAMPSGSSIILPPATDTPHTETHPPRREKTLHFSREPAPSVRTVGTTAPTQRVAIQVTNPPRNRNPRRELQAEESVQYTVPTELPSPDRLWKVMQSDKNLMEMIRQEKRSQNIVERIVFPEEQPISKVAYAGRRWEPLTEEVQPGYVIYQRLLFEQKNAERYGWDIGVIHPLVSALAVYCDVVTLPYHIGVRPLQQFDSSAGYCLPGDPVPLLLYPPEWCCAGFGLEAAVVVPLFFAFP